LILTLHLPLIHGMLVGWSGMGESGGDRGTPVSCWASSWITFSLKRMVSPTLGTAHSSLLQWFSTTAINKYNWSYKQLRITAKLLFATCWTNYL
jgi:hypothetical protein